MIQIKNPTKPSKKKIKPYYLLTYNYMIGDADGYTSEEVELSADNPHIERHCKLLQKLKPIKGHWGISLNQEQINNALKCKQITKSDYDFLFRTMFPYDLDEEDENYIEDKFLDEFDSGIKSDTEYSFLTFQDLELIYVDENNTHHQTTFTKDKPKKAVVAKKKVK